MLIHHFFNQYILQMEHPPRASRMMTAEIEGYIQMLNHFFRQNKVCENFAVLSECPFYHRAVLHPHFY